jgi:hypothetical protein
MAIDDRHSTAASTSRAWALATWDSSGVRRGIASDSFSDSYGDFRGSPGTGCFRIQQLADPHWALDRFESLSLRHPAHPLLKRV